MAKKGKYLTGIEVVSRGKDMRWLNWYVNRGRVQVLYNQDAVLRSELRKISNRRVF